MDKSLGDEKTVVDDRQHGELDAGTMLGRYRIIKLLGRGGMGQVYLAQHELQKSLHALKILPSDFSSRPGSIERFQTELQTMARLQHDNIVHVTHSDEDGGLYYLVMDFVAVDGGDEPYDLEEALAEHKQLDPDTVRTLMFQICDGLAYAHANGVVHRDLKPANILLTAKSALGNPQSAIVKITDFGLAKVIGETHVQTLVAQSFQHSMSIGDADTFVEKKREDRSSSGSVLGTYGYMSPEQEEGKSADERSDIYALGVMMYRMITGQRLRGRAKAASSIVPGLDKRWDSIIDRCLEVDPEDRFQSVEELHKALRGKGLKPRNTRKPIMLIGLLVAGLLGTGAYLSYSSYTSRQAALAEEQARIAQEQKAVKAKELAAKLEQAKAMTLDAKSQAETARKGAEHAAADTLAKTDWQRGVESALRADQAFEKGNFEEASNHWKNAVEIFQGSEKTAVAVSEYRKAKEEWNRRISNNEQGVSKDELRQYAPEEWAAAERAAQLGEAAVDNPVAGKQYYETALAKYNGAVDVVLANRALEQKVKLAEAAAQRQDLEKIIGTWAGQYTMTVKSSLVDSDVALPEPPPVDGECIFVFYKNGDVKYTEVAGGRVTPSLGRYEYSNDILSLWMPGNNGVETLMKSEVLWKNDQSFEFRPDAFHMGRTTQDSLGAGAKNVSCCYDPDGNQILAMTLVNPGQKDVETRTITSPKILKRQADGYTGIPQRREPSVETVDDLRTKQTSESSEAILLDRETGLTWVQAPHDLPGNSDGMTWDAANTFCENLVFAGRSDWRLPSQAELLALAGKKLPFVGTFNMPYWGENVEGEADRAMWADLSGSRRAKGMKRSPQFVLPVAGENKISTSPSGNPLICPDSVEIITVKSRDQIAPGKTVTLEIEIGYNLLSSEEGCLRLGFNTRRPDGHAYSPDDFEAVSNGADRMAVKKNVLVPAWADERFSVMVLLTESRSAGKRGLGTVYARGEYEIPCESDEVYRLRRRLERGSISQDEYEEAMAELRECR